MNAVAKPPQPQPCHNCGMPYAGIACPICKEERPAYTAVKAMSAKARTGAQPITNAVPCRYYPESICGCRGIGTCLDVA